MLLAIDHVQLAMPMGEEEKARAFYSDVLGMTEVQKPAALATRGGIWFSAGQVAVHLGVEEEFRPAKKAHPAFAVSEAEKLRLRLRAAGLAVTEDAAIAGVTRFFSSDCFGNRLEFIEATS